MFGFKIRNSVISDLFHITSVYALNTITRIMTRYIHLHVYVEDKSLSSHNEARENRDFDLRAFLYI